MLRHLLGVLSSRVIHNSPTAPDPTDSFPDWLFLCCPGGLPVFPTHELSILQLGPSVWWIYSNGQGTKKTLTTFYGKPYKNTAQQTRYERTVPCLSQHCCSGCPWMLHYMGMAANRLHGETQQTLCSEFFGFSCAALLSPGSGALEPTMAQGIPEFWARNHGWEPGYRRYRCSYSYRWHRYTTTNYIYIKPCDRWDMIMIYESIRYR